MKKHEAFPSRYLAASDFEEDQTLTIDRWSLTDFDGDKGKEQKVILYFAETDKGLVLNKTNWGSIEKVTGSEDTDDWIGKQVTFYATQVPFGAEMVWSIRVREPKPKSSGGAFKKSNGNGHDSNKPADRIDPDKVLQAAKTEAWTIFNTKFSAVPQAERMSKLAEIVAATFPGQAPATLNTHQWQALVRNDFEVPGGASVLGENDFSPDEIPF